MNGKSKQTLFSLLVALLICLMAGYLLVCQKSAVKASKDGFYTAFFMVLPSVFPFFVLSGLAVNCGLFDSFVGKTRWFSILFSLPECCFGAVVIGLLCGFPVGARMACDLVKRGSIDPEQGARLAAFTNFCSPSYLIGVLGSQILGSWKLGFLIYLIQTVFALGAGILLGRGKKGKFSPLLCQEKVNFSLAFTESVAGAIKASLGVCAYITLFSVLMSAFSPLFCKMPNTASALLYGFFEMSGGVRYLKGEKDALLAAAFIVFWSGLSVVFQIISALWQEKEKISILPFLRVRAVCVPLGGVLVYLICRILHFT